MWRMDCVDVDTHAWRHTLTHACPLAASSQEDGPVVRRGAMLFRAQVRARGNQRVLVSVLATPKNSAKPPRARHASSEDTRAPGRRPAWRRARRGTNATCPSDATWQHKRLDMRRDKRGKQGEWRTRACGRRKRYASASAQGASQYASKRRESPGGLSALEEPLEGDQKVGERAGESRKVRQGERHAE